MHPPSESIGHIINHFLKNYFKKRYPYTAKRQYAYMEIQQIKSKGASLITFVIVMFYFFLLSFLYGIILNYIHLTLFKQLIKPPDIFYPGTLAVFVIAGFFFMLCSISFFSTKTLRLIAEGDYDRMTDYYNAQFGYDGEKALSFFSKLFIIPAIVALVIVFPTRLVIHEQSFTIKKVNELTADSYSYGDVSKIVYYHYFADNKGLKIDALQPHYRLFFKDATTMSMNVYFDGANDAAGFIKELSLRTKLLVDTTDVDDLRFR